MSAADIARLDMTREAIEAEAQQIWAERNRRVAALTLRLAAKRTNSPSDRIGDSLAAWLVKNPGAAPVAVDPDWDHHIAQVEALNAKHREVARFNALYPVGTPVLAYPGCRPEDGPDATAIETRTRSRAEVFCGHTAVVWVDGHGACIALSHIDIRTGGAS